MRNVGRFNAALILFLILFKAHTLYMDINANHFQSGHGFNRFPYILLDFRRYLLNGLAIFNNGIQVY